MTAAPTAQPCEVILTAAMVVIAASLASASIAGAHDQKTAPVHASVISTAAAPSFLQTKIRPLSNYSKGFLENTIAASTATLTSLPDNAPALATRGIARWKLEQYHAALRDLEKAISLSPKLKDYYVIYVAGECYREIDEKQKSLDAFTRSLQIEPAFSICHLRRAQVLMDLKQYKKALPEMDYLVKTSKDQAWVHALRGKIRRLDGQYQAALEDCTKAISAEPNDASLYSDRALVYERLGQKELAAKDRKTNELLTKDSFPQ